MPFEKFPHPPRYEPLKKALITLLGNDKMYQEMGTVFENHRKSSIQDCERSGQKVIPDRSILKGQKFMKSAKIKMRYFEKFSNIVKSFDLFIVLYILCVDNSKVL